MCAFRYSIMDVLHALMLCISPKTKEQMREKELVKDYEH